MNDFDAYPPIDDEFNRYYNSISRQHWHVWFHEHDMLTKTCSRGIKPWNLTLLKISSVLQIFFKKCPVKNFSKTDTLSIPYGENDPPILPFPVRQLSTTRSLKRSLNWCLVIELSAKISLFSSKQLSQIGKELITSGSFQQLTTTNHSYNLQKMVLPKLPRLFFEDNSLPLKLYKGEFSAKIHDNIEINLIDFNKF